MTVFDVLSYLAAGMTAEEILEDFPYLTADDIQACLSYAAERERQMFVGDGLKLLFDQNLSPKPANRLADLFPGSCHVMSLGLDPAMKRSGIMPATMTSSC